MAASASSPGKSGAITVKILRSYEEVESIRSFWSSTDGRRDSDMDVFLATLRSLPVNTRPHVIAAFRDGEPETVLVGRYEDALLPLRIGYSTFAKLRVRLLVFVQGGLRGRDDDGNIRLIIFAVKDCLKQGDADLALFHYVDVESELFRQSLHLPGFFTRDWLPDVDPYWSKVMGAGSTDAWKTLSIKHRSQLRKRMKSLSDACQGEIRIESFATMEALPSFFRDAESIASRSYQRKMGVGFLKNLETRERYGVYARKGWLRAFVLYAGDTPCAFASGTLNDGKFCSDFLAFDASLKKYSPGTYLVVRVLDELRRQGAGEIDFGSGSSEYKQRFGNVQYDKAHIYIAAPSLRGMTVNWIRVADLLIHKILRRTLDNLKLLPRVRRILRGRSSRMDKGPSATARQCRLHGTRVAHRGSRAERTAV